MFMLSNMFLNVYLSRLQSEFSVEYPSPNPNPNPEPYPNPNPCPNPYPYPIRLYIGQ